MEGSILLNIHPDSDESDDGYYSDSADSEGSSVSSGELISSNVGIHYKEIKITDQRLEDYTLAADYEKVRNKYFTPEITKHSVSVLLEDGGPTSVTLTDYGFTIDRVIGFKLVKGYLTHAKTPSAGEHIDIIIPEVPYIACVKNSTCSHLIQRLSAYTTGAFYYENKNLFRDIYFTPIKLSQLTITHAGCTGGNLEFEITTLHI